MNGRNATKTHNWRLSRKNNTNKVFHIQLTVAAMTVYHITLSLRLIVDLLTVCECVHNKWRYWFAFFWYVCTVHSMVQHILVYQKHQRIVHMTCLAQISFAFAYFNNNWDVLLFADWVIYLQLDLFFLFAIVFNSNDMDM